MELCEDSSVLLIGKHILMRCGLLSFLLQELCKGEGHWWNKTGKCQDTWENQIEALYERGTREFDTKKRIAIGFSIQNVYAQQLPQIFLTALNLHAAWDNRLQGEYTADLISPLTGTRDLNTLWLKQ